MKSLLAKLALASCLSLAAGITQATPWTFTVSGIADYGFTYDSNGGNYLDQTGKAYTLSYTLDPSLYSTQYGSSYYSGGDGSQSGAVSITATLGGVTRSYALDLSLYNGNWGQSYLTNGLSQYGTGGYADYAYQTQQGYTANYDDYVTAYAYVYSYLNAFVSDLNFDQTWSYTPQNGDEKYAALSSSGTQGSTYFYDYDPTSFSINQANDVPEPSSLALLGLALAGFGAVRRRQIA